MPGFSTITAPQLMRLIGTPDAPHIIDLRLPEDMNSDPYMIPGAIRHSHTDLPGLLTRLDRRPSVTLCHGGMKISHGTAAFLRAAGHDAESLEGGMLAWRAASLPAIPLAALPASTRWVTRHRPKIDRIACPWLIRRFVDAQAIFLFVPPSEVQAVADHFDATSFDIEGVHFTHRGPACTFDAMIADFGLSHPALDRLAAVVRAADTDRHADAPQAAGLLALSVGLSRMYRDDTAQLEAAMPLYDALYRWARDGADEGHDWPADRIA